MKRFSKLLVLVFVMALIAAACGSDSEETTTTAAAGTDETTTTAAPAETTTTATVAPDPGFEGKALDAGGCDYGGRVEKITALDEFTVEFDLCGPHPAFLAQMAFIVFGIQSEESLEASSGAPLDTPVGTGPYSLQEWVRGDSVIFARNDDYYGTMAPHSTAVLKWST
ncbi:MAG: ABC transporter substrate-binding protein, partial [Actinomycetota bacterium]|nr:ABC transporter substrate-binding protein [Actinomycetota bacterium]